ncbi:hypothetical protein WMY93_013808 [Mugilogobius chulae]|uniref:WH2 domain-containing protein n=1 Tax=Mugilogobius chulae TaxID=88201 RepID=A0AAW0PB52_9GOBI
MSVFGYRRELSKYEDVDEDELLASLSPEELAELEKELADIEPDTNVPIGLRQRDQTDKTPTGTFSREALMKYWENETRRLLEDEIGGGSPKPDEEEFTETKVHNEEEEDKEEEENEEEECECEEEESEEEESEEEEPVTEEDEEEEEEQDNKTQSEKSSSRFVTSEAPTLLKQPRAEPMRLTPPPPPPPLPASDQASGNPTVVDDVLQKVLSNDPEVTDVNLNNIDDVSQETLIRFAEALRSNSHVRTFSLANTHADDPVALAISKMLRENSSIVSLNIESNYVSGKGVMALVQALPKNSTLTELRFHNQRHICGGQVEMEMDEYDWNSDQKPGPTEAEARGGAEAEAEPTGGGRECCEPQDFCTERYTLFIPIHFSMVLAKTLPQSSHKAGSSSSATTSTSSPPPPPPASPLAPAHGSKEKKENKPTRMIAAVIKAHEASDKKSTKVKGKKSKKGKSKDSGEEETGSILKELKNALRPVVERRGEDSRPSTPLRSAHDQLMESIRGSNIRSLRKVELPHHLR